MTPWPCPGVEEREYLRDFDHQENENRLRAYHNLHAGQRCAILGNGPSLARTDLSLLGNVPLIGLNKIFLHFERMPRRPDYLVAMDPLVLQQSRERLDYLSLDMGLPMFLGHEALKWFAPAPGRTFFMSWNQEPHFSTDMTANIWQGYTVTFCALQLAYYLGFDEVVLVGVDHRFSFQGQPNTAQRLSGNDPNHFHPGYFRDMHWHTPDLAMCELAYTLARDAFHAAGRCIVDATIDGALQVFPKVELAAAVA